MNKNLKFTISQLILILIYACSFGQKQAIIQDVKGTHSVLSDQIWLTHEHILVDFIGADSIRSDNWNHDLVMKETIPYLEALKAFNVNYFVDATPAFLGRDAILLQKIANKTGLKILSNTGLYGAVENKFIPAYAYSKSAKELAQMWIAEFEKGIDGTTIKPGFIKISVDNVNPLEAIDHKLVEAAALTHLQTGLTIASHTGEAKALWPQLRILKERGVAAEAFIWVHAQAETDNENYLKAAQMGCWISFDGLGWELEDHVEKILFAKQNGILDKILISHDAGWYDPQKEKQDIKPYTTIFERLYPELKSRGFTDEEFNILISKNPSNAFGIGTKMDH